LSLLEFLTKKLLTSLYCEWYLRNNRNNDAINLNDRLSEINSRIKKPIRIDIVGKSYISIWFD
jgi:hypothetical protein